MNPHELEPTITRPNWLKKLAKIRPALCPDEPALHRQVKAILATSGVPFAHEVAFTPEDRIDFVVDEPGQRWGIECKINPHGNAVWRQCLRYADHCDVVVVLTTRPLPLIITPHPEHRAKAFEVVELCKNF